MKAKKPLTPKAIAALKSVLRESVSFTTMLWSLVSQYE